MQSPLNYDYFESLRQSGQWMGATAQAFWRNPVFALSPTPMPAAFAAWGEVAERAFEKVASKPDWGIDSVVSDHCEFVVKIDTLIDKPFGKLIHFRVGRATPKKRRVLLIAPMSGHYATLVRKTVISLLPDCEVYVTQWRNAREVPVSKGKFDIDDFTLYLLEYLKILGQIGRAHV